MIERKQRTLKNLRDSDIFQKIMPLLRAGYTINEKGLLEAKPLMSLETPWVHSVMDKKRNCNLWHKVFFDLLGILPSKCMECWKVVVRPSTLVDLFNLYELQMKMGRPSKCGAETRPTVFGLYGGYFYNDSQREGYTCLKTLQRLLPKYLENPDTPVFLKRACTEFEMKYGASNKWTIPPEQEVFENQVETMIDPDSILGGENTPQPEAIQVHVMKGWIQWAYQNGDSSYLNFTDGKPLYPAYVKYTES